MFVGSAKRKRHAFLERAIENARETFASDPNVHYRLGTLATRWTEMCDRLIIANVRHGEVRLPAKYRDTDYLPVITQTPGEKLIIPPEAPSFYPRQRLSVQHKLSAWGATLPIDQMTDSLAAAAWGHAQLSPALITPYEPGSRLAARVLSPGIRLSIKPNAFRNGGKNPLKVIRSRPLLAIPYDGPESAIPSPATFAHEFVHIEQVEADMLEHYLAPDSPKARKLHYRRELEATHIGACTAIAALDGGFTVEDLSAADTSQLVIEQRREDAVARTRRRDPFEPTGTLINMMREIGIDFTENPDADNS